MVLSPDRTSESPMELLKQSVSGPALQSEFVGLGDPSIRSFKSSPGASLVAQWLRICLPMQGTRVRALVWEDPTCRGATKPVSHSY